MTAIDEIKARIELVDLVSESVQLRRTGKNYIGFCPFHHNTRTPAFVVFPESNNWRCFGECNEGGDIFNFVMKKEGWDFPTALKYLAEKAGVQLEPQTPEREVEDEKTGRLRTLLEEAVTFYRHNLLQSLAGKPALDYLLRRGLTQVTIETFGLGYAPDSWESGLRYFSAKGYSQAELLEAGLVTERAEGKGVYDRFRNRIMFPIRDPAGRMAGFGARILNPQDQPKFINSPQTALFDKGSLLYGLDQARRAIRAKDQVVIVEGYLDVIMLHQGGFTNTVSPMGTALTEEQLRLLKRYTRRMVLALDADAAGQKATLRGLETARQALDHSEELAFDPRGLLRHEARLEADLRVTTLPEGQDPDEIVRRDLQEWTKILEAAQPVVIHVMQTLAAGQNLDDPKVKSSIASQVLPLIEDVPNAVEREDYRQRLARLLRVDERSLLGSGAAPAPRQPRRRYPASSQPGAAKRQAPILQTVRPAHLLESHCLRLLLRNPENIYKLDRWLQRAGLGRFSHHDFESTDHQLLARLVQQSLEQEDMEPLLFIQEHTPEPLRERVQHFLEPLPKGEPTAEKLVEDLAFTLLRLRLERVKDSLSQIRFLQEEMRDAGDLPREAYSEMVMQLTLIRQRLDKAIRSPGQTE